MPSTLSTRRTLLAILLAATATVAAACDDDPVEPEPEPTFNRVEFTLTSGNTTRFDTVNTSGVQNGNNTFPGGTTTVAVTNARFLRADNTVDPVITAADFELRSGAAGTSPGVTFALATGQSFQGTISGLTAGTRTIRMLLWHKAEGHEDFSQILTLVIQ